MEGLDGHKERIKLLITLVQICATFCLGIGVSLVTYITKKYDSISKIEEVLKREGLIIRNPYPDPDVIVNFHLILFVISFGCALSFAISADRHNDAIFRLEAIEREEKDE